MKKTLMITFSGICVFFFGLFCVASFAAQEQPIRVAQVSPEGDFEDLPPDEEMPEFLRKMMQQGNFEGEDDFPAAPDYDGENIGQDSFDSEDFVDVAIDGEEDFSGDEKGILIGRLTFLILKDWR